MYIVFLRFGENRSQASHWMAAHNSWLAEGFQSGVFVVAGSLENGQGGVLLARDMDSAALMARIGQDPFVLQGVVSAEVHRFKPSRLADGIAAVVENGSIA